MTLWKGQGACMYVCILPCRGSRLCCRAWLAGRSTCVCSPASCSAAVTCSRRTTPTHTHTIIPNPSPNASPSTSPNIRSSTSPNTSPASNYTKHTHTHNYSQPTHTQLFPIQALALVPTLDLALAPRLVLHHVLLLWHVATELDTQTYTNRNAS